MVSPFTTPVLRHISGKAEAPGAELGASDQYRILVIYDSLLKYAGRLDYHLVMAAT